MNISFFAKPYFFDTPNINRYSPFLHRGSSLIRGKQIAEYIGAKYNPKVISGNDILIYLKPRSFRHIPDTAYIDVIDGNEVIFIPQHHCNFERIKKDRNKITTAGMITHPSPENFILAKEMRNLLKKTGINFITCFYYQNPQDVTDFYKQIDLQVFGCFGLDGSNPYKHPLKLVNAASFGIPTITNPMKGYEEFEDYYIPVKDKESLVEAVEKMKDKNIYNSWADKISKKAEEYHIEKIAKMYAALK